MGDSLSHLDDLLLKRDGREKSKQSASTQARIGLTCDSCVLCTTFCLSLKLATNRGENCLN